LALLVDAREVLGSYPDLLKQSNSRVLNVAPLCPQLTRHGKRVLCMSRRAHGAAIENLALDGDGVRYGSRPEQQTDEK
jgi:hypothetical protein